MAMNFPGSGCISDDAQFFFEDYNFYNAIYAQQPQPQIIQQNFYPNANNLGPIPIQNTVIQQVHDQTQIRPEYAFQNVVSDTLVDDRGQNNQSVYTSVGYDLLQNDTQIHDQRNRTESISSLDGKKAKSIHKSTTSSNKVCRVCGDKALGYNFNVVTCESCKAFFRRNALKKKKLQCPFQNRCTITVASRRYCQKCRLRKCFEVGMRAEYIMTEEQRAQKRQRLLERETLESGALGAPLTPRSDTYGDDVFGDEEFKIRTQNGMSNGFEETRQDSPKSISESSEHEQNPIDKANNDSTVDVAAWVNQIPQPQHTATTTLSSPTETTTSNTVSALVDTDDDMVTIRIPKSSLMNMLFKPDRNHTMTTLEQAVLASAISNKNGAKERSPNCACPCACSYGQTQQHQSNGASYLNGFSEKSSNYQPSSENQLVKANQSILSNQNQNTGNRLNSVSISSNSSNNDTISYPMEMNQNSQMSPRSSDFDTEFLTSLSTAFNVDWQMPLAFPTFLNLSTKFEKLDELLLANEEWNHYNQVMFPLKGSTVHEFTAQDFYSLVHFALRCVIRQYSRLNAFSTLPFEDQQALIKNSIRELFTLRSIMKYDVRRQIINAHTPGKEHITLELTKRIRGGVYNEFKQLVASYPEKLRSDETLMLILSALVLFNPDSPSLIHREAVKKQHDSYRQLLKDYMENTYGAEETRSMYDYLIERVKEIVHWVHKYSIRMFFEMDPKTMEPVLVQIFDFN